MEMKKLINVQLFAFAGLTYKLDKSQTNYEQKLTVISHQSTEGPPTTSFAINPNCSLTWMIIGVKVLIIIKIIPK
jgi:hypothetical protein